MRPFTNKEKAELTAGRLFLLSLWDGLSCLPSHFYRSEKEAKARRSFASQSARVLPVPQRPPAHARGKERARAASVPKGARFGVHRADLADCRRDRRSCLLAGRLRRNAS